MAFQGVTNFRTIAIQTLLEANNEPNTKKYLVYDSDGDPTNIYIAQANASGGEQCLEQVLVYATTSGVKNVAKIGWRTATWSGSAWDIS